MAPIFSKWWLVEVSCNKLCLYTKTGCRGQVMDMEKTSDNTTVKVTLHHGCVRLHKIGDFVSSHNDGCNKFRDTSTVEELTQAWSLYSGKSLQETPLQHEELDSDLQILQVPPPSHVEELDSLSDEPPVKKTKKDHGVLQVPPPSHVEELDSLSDEPPVKKTKKDHGERPNTSMRVIKRIVMGICRPQDTIVIHKTREPADARNITKKDSVPSQIPTAVRGFKGSDQTEKTHKNGRRLILGDSLSRGISGKLQNCDVFFYPGATVKTLAKSLKNIDLTKYNAILIHVGTNAISSFNKYNFKVDYFKLIRSLISLNPDAVVLCCDIIPRIRDFNETQGLVIRANNIIRHVCTVLDCKNVRTSKRFLHKGTGEPRHYLYCSDGLHLNDKGKYQLKRSFDQALSHANR